MLSRCRQRGDHLALFFIVDIHGVYFGFGGQRSHEQYVAAKVWNHVSALQPCKCPLCRRQITLLIPSEASSRQHPSAEVSEILQKVEHYNRLFGELQYRQLSLWFYIKKLCLELHFPTPPPHAPKEILLFDTICLTLSVHLSLSEFSVVQYVSSG